MKRFDQLLHLNRARRLSLFAALMAFFLATVDSAYASGTMQAYVTIPNTTPSPSPTPTAAPDELLDPNPNSPSLIELDAIKTVDANEMALVSLAARRVEAAKIPDGARLVAKEMVLSQYGWSTSQFSCLNQLWTRESNWRYQARNKTSGAHGIAQALPATKMEVVGTDWRTNPITQITWGLKYISERYETPCLALRKFKRSHWY
ncbi:unannotated protein [freshwater metagenome]|uniref:Unannotated protein n=1 Tax=freshwater metagenome TaxID=449393 RepID=A0A6J7MJE9_9ZZZZ|nr:transglycosylase SLT domain-containing protein [Actinomycetota bacterium]